MIRIGFMYPELMDLYGDKGNVTVLRRRLEWRDIEVEVKEVHPNDSSLLKDCDLLMLGGGMDRDQVIVARDLEKREKDLSEAIDAGTVILAICGSYQLLGHYFQPLEGERIEGIGILDIHTVAGKKRLVGNAAILSPFGTLVGYENHSGRTYLGKKASPLGKVLTGYGNNGEDSFEGAFSENIFATYLHGPLLSKNPVFADHLLSLALKRHGEISFPSLDDRIELQANRTMEERLIGK
ncbi:MAG TPA: cobalamin biosynthesis protein CobQ [Chroococcales cyanobacterium]|jgi:hypothetical protein